MTKLFVAAADPSGDALLAALMPALQARIPGLQVEGLAGPLARAAGVAAVAHAEDYGAVGLVEVLTSVPAHIALLARLEAAAVASGARVVLTVDAPSLLLRLARRLKRRGLAVVHWVSPQVWAWRGGRVHAVARSVDTVLCLLPFEPPWYEGLVRAVFVGHPAAAIHREPLPSGPLWIALCPGSRTTEVRALWPVLREVGRLVCAQVPARLVVPVAPSVDRSLLTGLDVTFVDRMGQLAGAQGAVVASGTATLELAALDVPQVAIYRVHPWTAAVGRRLLTVDRIALPNLLGAGDLVPEHVQELVPHAIARDLLACLGRRAQVPRQVIDALAGPQAVSRTADELVAWLVPVL